MGWHIGKDEKKIEAFLRDHETTGVSACDRYVRRQKGRDALWVYQKGPSGIRALVYFHGPVVYPMGITELSERETGELTGVLQIQRKREQRPWKDHLKPFVSSLQGLLGDVRALEGLLLALGLTAKEKNEYYLMGLEQPSLGRESQHKTEDPKGEGADRELGGELVGLSILRSDFRAPDGFPLPSEKIGLVDQLYPLQEAYEKEEVVPPGYPFNPGACRNGLERLLQDQVVFTAWLDGFPVAKANTNAFAYRQAQIGGVFVRPEFRGRGIAKRLVRELVHTVVDQGWQVRLFVKKDNQPAIAVYRHLGFTIQDEYGIFYY
jgi:hypothetical protein